MNPKQIAKQTARQADKAMDPIGVVLVVAAYFLNKYHWVELTTDEVLLISIGAGALRSVWEGYKRRKNVSTETNQVAPNSDRSNA